MVEPLTMTFDKVTQIIEALRASDPDWTYKPVPIKKGDEFLWAIEVSDEEGVYISTFNKSESDE